MTPAASDGCKKECQHIPGSIGRPVRRALLVFLPGSGLGGAGSTASSEAGALCHRTVYWPGPRWPPNGYQGPKKQWALLFVTHFTLSAFI